MLFYEIRFENEGFDLAIHDNKFKVDDQSNELSRLSILISARLKILAYAAPQILCLADINDLSVTVLMQINADCGWQRFEFFQ